MQTVVADSESSSGLRKQINFLTDSYLNTIPIIINIKLKWNGHILCFCKFLLLYTVNIK